MDFRLAVAWRSLAAHHHGRLDQYRHQRQPRRLEHPTGLEMGVPHPRGLPNGLGALLMAWANEIFSGDNEERAFVAASMNPMGSAIQAWLPLLIWKQVDAPRYHKSFMSMAIAIALIASTMLTRFLQKKEDSKKMHDQFLV